MTEAAATRIDGLALQARTRVPAEKLERETKLGLAFHVASQEMMVRIFDRRMGVDEAVADIEAKVIPEIKRWRESVRTRNATRRMERVLEALEKPQAQAEAAQCPAQGEKTGVTPACKAARPEFRVQRHLYREPSMKHLALLVLCVAALVGLLVAAPVVPEAHALGELDGLMTLPLIGGLIINAQSLQDVFTAFNSAFNTGFRGASALWDRVATLVPSSTTQNHNGWLGQFPRLREWLGDRHVKGLETHDYTIKNKPFEATIGVDRDQLEDDTFGVYGSLFQEMGFAAATHPDELVFSLLADGFNQLAYDGQNFFDTDHEVGGVSVSNLQAGAGDPWFLLDTRRPLKPLIFQRRRDYRFQAMTREDDEAVFMRKEYRYGVDARSRLAAQNLAIVVNQERQHGFNDN